MQTLDNQLSESYPQSCFDKANNFHTGAQYLASYTYDLVILDINMICGYELIIRAIAHKFPVLVLGDNDRALSPKEQFISSRAQAILTKRNINAMNMVTILEEIVRSRKSSKLKRNGGDYKKICLSVKNCIFERKQNRKSGFRKALHC